MRDDPDSVIDEYKRFLNIGRAPSRSRTSDMRTRVRRVLKPAKRIVRGRRFRHATSRARILPSFIIIGAQRAGTTSLFDYLGRHPDVASDRGR